MRSFLILTLEKIRILESETTELYERKSASIRSTMYILLFLELNIFSEIKSFSLKLKLAIKRNEKFKIVCCNGETCTIILRAIA